MRTNRFSILSTLTASFTALAVKALLASVSKMLALSSVYAFSRHYSLDILLVKDSSQSLAA
jgi:hypothetical protein